MPHLIRLLAAMMVASSAVLAAAGEPVPAPFAPSSVGLFGARRPVAYVVVDTVPRVTHAPATYPYGWFGAAPHATMRWSHTDYYNNYTDVRILRGR